MVQHILIFLMENQLPYITGPMIFHKNKFYFQFHQFKLQILFQFHWCFFLLPSENDIMTLISSQLAKVHTLLQHSFNKLH